jgi:hypothetical protein
MTETVTENGLQPEDLGPLPDVVKVPIAFVTRMPSQRIVELLERIEPTPIGELMTHQQSRICAFRKLVAEHPHRDPTSLWMHAYDVEIEVADALDPTRAAITTTAPPSAVTGASDPTSSTA